MGASKLLKLAAKGGTFLKAHKTTICMCAGLVTGVGAVVECGHATVKSCKKVNEVNELRRINGDQDLTKKEIVQLCWKNYLLTAGLTFAAIGTTAYGYGVTLKQLGVATAGAKAAETECKQLKDSIEDVLGDEEHKEIKDKVIDRFAERKAQVYGDSTQPVDIFRPMGTPPCNFNKGNVVERFKDKFGAEFLGTRADIRYAVAELHSIMKDDGGLEYVDTLHRLMSDDIQGNTIGNDFVWDPEKIRDINDIDVRLTPDYDADGLFWNITYTIEPTYVG